MHDENDDAGETVFILFRFVSCFFLLLACLSFWWYAFFASTLGLNENGNPITLIPILQDLSHAICFSLFSPLPVSLFEKQRRRGRRREGGKDFQSCFLSLTRFNRFLVFKSVLSSANEIDPQNSWYRRRELKLNIACIQSYSGICTRVWNHFCIPGKTWFFTCKSFLAIYSKIASSRFPSTFLLETSSPTIFLPIMWQET